MLHICRPWLQFMWSCLLGCRSISAMPLPPLPLASAPCCLQCCRSAGIRAPPRRIADSIPGWHMLAMQQHQRSSEAGSLPQHHQQQSSNSSSSAACSTPRPVRTVGQHVAGLLVGAVANVGHDDAASLELPAHTRVNTLGPAPALLQHSGAWCSTMRRHVSARAARCLPASSAPRAAATAAVAAVARMFVLCIKHSRSIHQAHTAPASQLLPRRHAGGRAHLDRDPTVALVALEALGALLDALHAHQRSHHLVSCSSKWRPRPALVSTRRQRGAGPACPIRRRGPCAALMPACTPAAVVKGLPLREVPPLQRAMRRAGVQVAQAPLLCHQGDCRTPQARLQRPGGRQSCMSPRAAWLRRPARRPHLLSNLRKAPKRQEQAPPRHWAAAVHGAQQHAGDPGPATAPGRSRWPAHRDQHAIWNS